MTTSDISRLDVPLADVEKQVAQAAGCLAEQAHLLDPADTAFARLACEHPECCSTPDDYNNWTPGGTA